ncbi:MAG: hypothetical protein HYV09_28570 [Deltaproteobacteria bacterium]|nr:hypothetical protein [Deltaproteobacteria bacterium]
MRRLLARLRRSLAPLGLGLVAAAGCYNAGEGADPNDRAPYFPVGLAISPSGRWLFVANSNFDLRYNAGTVQAYDLAGIAARARECRDLRRKGVHSRECDVGEAASTFVRAGVRIGAFAADMRAIERRREGVAVPDAGRLLLPVRGDASLTTIDFDEAGDRITLRCTPGAQPNTFGVRCSPDWRIGTDVNKSARALALEGEPFGIAVPDWWPADPAAEPRASGGVAALVHQSTGNTSLFVSVAVDNGSGPPTGRLAHVLGGLPRGGTSIAPLDLGDGILRFLVTNRTQSNVLVVQYLPDKKAERGALVLADSTPIVPQGAGFDTRGVVVDPPNAGETRPTRVFITNRTPAALVVGQIDPATKKLFFYDNMPLPVGPSRLTRAIIDGKTWILAASFDARSVVVYDPDLRRIVNVIRTHRGPYAVTFDAARKLGLVCNFTDSSIQVIELDPAQAAESDYQRVIYSVGVPSGPSR